MTTPPDFPPDSPGHSRLTRTEWLICFVAALGFAFDIYELLMLPLIVGPALLDLLGAKPGSPEFNLWVGWLFWLPADRRRDLRPARGLPHRPVRPSPRPRVEHPALRVLRDGRGLRALGRLAALLPLHDLRRRVRRVRGGGRVAGGAVPRAQAAGGRAGLDPGLLLGGRPDGDGRLLPRRPLRRVPARDRREPRAVALHPDLGRHPRHPADRHPPLPAGIPGLAGEEGSRDPQAPEPGGDLPGRPQEGHPRHHPHVRVQLRRRLRGHPARAPHRARTRRGERPASPRPAEGGERGPGLPGVRRSRRADDPRLPGRAHPVAAPPPAHLPGAGPRAPARRLRLGRDDRPRPRSSGASSWSAS